MDDIPFKMTMAVMLQHWDEVKLLVAKGYPLNEGDAQSGLRLACRTHLPTVKLLFEHGADLNYEDPAETSTPLLSACFAGNYEIATFLVKNGAKVNHTDSLGKHPLQILVQGMNPNTKLAEYLLTNGADPNTVDEDGRPIIVQAKLKHLDDIVALLLKFKAKDEEPTTEEWEHAEQEDEDRYDEGEGEQEAENDAPNNGKWGKWRVEEDTGDSPIASQSVEFPTGFAMTQIGTSYLNYDGDYEAAVEFFEQSIDADPDYENAYLHIIKAYTLMGKQPEADKYKTIFKDKFKKSADEVDYDKMLAEQERQREIYMASLPNVSTIRL